MLINTTRMITITTTITMMTLDHHGAPQVEWAERELMVESTPWETVTTGGGVEGVEGVEKVAEGVKVA